MALGRLHAEKTDAELFQHFYERAVRAETEQHRRARQTTLVGQVVVLGALVGLWWAASTVYPPVLVPSPPATVQAFVDGRATLWENTPITIAEIVLGFLVGSLLGIGFGVVIGQSRWAEVIFTPYLVVSQAVPKVALAPILIIVLGYGLASKVAVAALIAFFPLLENTIGGLRQVDPDSLRLLRSLGATRWQIFMKLRVFSALPLIFAGLRIAAVLATVGAIVGEFVAGNRGLGALLVTSMGTFSTSLLYATMGVLTVLACGVYLAAQWGERRALARYNLAPPEA
ncbi:MAG TPA: ABC transporter permease [Candidatus Bathyarchaeia archaeon]|nr:ABC transporter permease [Candidatus Bathyarchaeia archaeon]